jgi:DNA-binding transcriptional MocR family regulator
MTELHPELGRAAERCLRIGRVDAPIDMSRVTAPAVPSLDEALKRTLGKLRETSDLSALMRAHTYGGASADRGAAASWLSKQLDLQIDGARLIMTHGTLNAVQMVLLHLLGSKGTLLTEALTYPQIPAAASVIGVSVRSVEMDREGILPDELEQACRRLSGPKVLYCVPTIQNPTAAIMSVQRRKDVVDVARRHGLSIIEDDAQGLIPTDVPPPLAAVAPDITWYVVGLSKVLSMGLRIALLVGPSSAAVEALTRRFRPLPTWFPAPLSAAIATEWLTDGTASCILEEVRAEARERQLIAREVLHRIEYFAHPHALHLWLEARGEASVEQLLTAAANDGLTLRSGKDFLMDPKKQTPGIRVSLADPAHPSLRRGLAILARTLKANRRPAAD